MGKRGLVRREPRPKEVLELCQYLAQEVAPPPKGTAADLGATPTPCTWPCSSSAPSTASPTGPQRPTTGPPADSLPLSPGPGRLRPETPGRGAAGAAGTAGAGGGSPASPRGRGAPLFLMDSTGLAYRSKDTVLRWRRGQEERRMRGYSRLLALVQWRRGQKLLAPWAGWGGRMPLTRGLGRGCSCGLGWGEGCFWGTRALTGGRYGRWCGGLGCGP